MIIHLHNSAGPETIEILGSIAAMPVGGESSARTWVCSSKIKQVPDQLSPMIRELILTESDIQLASDKYRNKPVQISVGDQVLGKDTGNSLIIAGPCSVENEKQLLTIAEKLSVLGVKVFRGGAYKPRTSPYSFQGLGKAGLDILKEVRQQFGMSIITEITNLENAEPVIEMTDIIQIGTKSMYDRSVLKATGNSGKPVLLKRGFGATLQEFVQAAETIMLTGNEEVILCERGIRTFENHTRFTLDLCGVAWLKKNTCLPVLVDPSHAMGYAYGVPDLARASLAMGVQGLMVEVHNNPPEALSDANQQLNPEQFEELYQSLLPVAKAVGKKII